MAAVEDDDDDALYGSGAAVGEAGGGDVGLGGNAAVAEEAALEDEGAGAKAEEGGEAGADEEEEDEDDGVDVIIDQEDLQTPGRPGGAGAWGGAAAMVSPCYCALRRRAISSPALVCSRCLQMLSASGPLTRVHITAKPKVCAQRSRGQAGRAGEQGGRGGG